MTSTSAIALTPDQAVSRGMGLARCLQAVELGATRTRAAFAHILPLLCPSWLVTRSVRIIAWPQQPDPFPCRHIRLNTWAGHVQYRPYEAVRNTVCIEDPFDATDNPGRSLAATTVDFVADEFLDAAQYIKALRDEHRARMTVLLVRHACACALLCIPLRSYRDLPCALASL